MTTMNRTVFVVAVLFCETAFAQSSTYVDNNGPRTIKWDEMANTIVEVDGLAWGAHSKGLGAQREDGKSPERCPGLFNFI